MNKMAADITKQKIQNEKLVVAVLGANGKSGRAFVALALAAGVTVRAGYRSSYSPPAHEALTVLRCDAANKDDVRRLLQGANAVVSLLGHGKNTPEHMQINAMKVLAEVMQELKITRIVSLTGTGVRFAGDTPSLIDRILNFSIAKIDPKRINDGIDHVKFLQSTKLDWTILRVLKLTNGAHAGRVQLSKSGPVELFTPRQRVASAILQTLDEASFIREAPIVQGVERD